MFEYDQENDVKTLKPVKAITWEGPEPDKVTITDVQEVCVIVR